MNWELIFNNTTEILAISGLISTTLVSIYSAWLPRKMQRLEMKEARNHEIRGEFLESLNFLISRLEKYGIDRGSRSFASGMASVDPTKDVPASYFAETLKMEVEAAISKLLILGQAFEIDASQATEAALEHVLQKDKIGFAKGAAYARNEYVEVDETVAWGAMLVFREEASKIMKQVNARFGTIN